MPAAPSRARGHEKQETAQGPPRPRHRRLARHRPRRGPRPRPRGAHVVVAARTIGALEELDDEIRNGGGKATLLQLDLSKGDKIDQLGPTLFQRWGKLDILVGNAGILGPLSPLHHVTEDAWNQVIDINLSANWRLIRTLDPLLKRSDAGRAVFVSSGAATGKYAYWGPYAVSKAGLEALVKTYAHELANTPRARQPRQSRARCARRCAPRRFRAKTPIRCPTPERAGADVPGAGVAGVRALRPRRQLPRLEEEARPRRRLQALERARGCSCRPQSKSMTMLS